MEKQKISAFETAPYSYHGMVIDIIENLNISYYYVLSGIQQNNRLIFV